MIEADFAPDQSGLRRMLSEEQVLTIVPVSAATLWRMQRSGRFPRATFISPNKKIWFEDEIVAWQAEINRRGPGDARQRAQRARRAREKAAGKAVSVERTT